MANELNTIRTTELQTLNVSQVVDILVNSADDAGRITLTDFLASLPISSDWYSITSKPFTDLDRDYFATKISEGGFPVLSFNENISADLHKLSEISDITNGLSARIAVLETDSHTHENKEIIDLFSITEDNKLSWNGAEVGYKLTPATTEILGGVKPDGVTITIDEDGTLHGANTYELPAAAADSLGGVKIDNTDINITENGVIHLGIASIDTLGGVKVDGDSIAIHEDGTLFAVPKGLDFQAIAAAMTGGTLDGIEITADEKLEVFNFNVTRTSEIKIDDEGYWTVNGDRGDNPTKAQGKPGTDGISPIIDPNTKNWIIGTVDTGVKAEAQSNHFYTGIVFPTSDLINGDLFLSFAEDTKGNVYQYQELTLDWVFQGNLYGGGAMIDDTSTAGNTVTWSANKINSVIGDINNILESVTGGII